MEIIWYGQSCFSLKAREGEIVIDPFGKTGLPVPRLKANMVLVTHDHPDHANISAVEGIGGKKPFIINGPGEYEVGGLIVNGVRSFHDNQNGADRGENTMYILRAEEMTVCHLGDLGQVSLSDAQLESLNGVDVLMVPIGGKFTIDAKEAVDIISQIEPKMVIPMHYKVAGLTIDLGGVEEFARAEGISLANAKDVLKISAGNLPEEERETVILKPKK